MSPAPNALNKPDALNKPSAPKKSQEVRALLLKGLVLALVLVSAPVLADDVSQLAARLSALRGEVEQLAQELNNKSLDQKNQLQSLARQRADLELEVKREETRVQKLSSSIAKQRAEIQAEKAKGDRLVPLFESELADVKAYVTASMPFRQQERLSALEKIDEQYKAGLLTPARALQRLWSFVEDEFRMTRESGLFKQTVRVDGQEVLAEVIRVGMVMLFYRTDDDQVGKLARKDGGWEFESIIDPERQRQVLDLFGSFKKQIRVGYFELPNALLEAPQDVSELPPFPTPPKPEPEAAGSAPAPNVDAPKEGAPGVDAPALPSAQPAERPAQ